MENNLSDKLRRNIFIGVLTILLASFIYIAIAKRGGDNLSVANNLKLARVAEYINESNRELALFRQAQTVNDKEAIENHLSKSIASARNAEAIDPDNKDIIEYLGRIYVEASSVSSDALEYAELYYKKLNALQPHDATADNNLGYILYMKGEKANNQEEKESFYNSSLVYYDSALGKEAEMTNALYGKAITLDKLGKMDESIEAMGKATLGDPNNQEYSYELGRMYYNRAIAKSEGSDVVSLENEDIEVAEELFKNILSAEPRHANAMYSLAVLYQKTGGAESAQTLVNSLLEIVKEKDQVELIEEQFKDIY